MDDTTLQVIFGIVVPLVVATTFAAVGAKATPDRAGRDRLAWRLVVAAALPVAVAFVALYGWPEEQWQSMTWVPAAGAAVGVAMSLTARRAWIRVMACVVVAAGCTACVWPVIERETILLKLLPAGAILVLALGVEPLAVRRPGPTTPLALALVAGTAAVIVLISGFMKLSVPAGALSVALLAVAGVAVVRNRSLSLADGPIAVIAPLLVLAPYVAWLYATSYDNTLPAWCFAVPAVAPLALWIGEVRFLRAAPVRLALVAAPCVLAIVVALDPPEKPVEEDPYADLYRELMGGG